MHSLLPLVVVLSLAAQAPPVLPPVPTLPAAALASADRGPLALALVLAESGVPGGLVTTDQPDRDPGSVVITPDSPPVEGAAVARRLEDRHPPYAVDWRRGVMGIEPGPSVCGERLTSTTVGPVTVEGQLSHLLVVLGWLASGDKPPVHAGVVSRIDQDPTDLAPPAPARALRLELTTATPLRDALDRLVRENAGGVWIAWQHSLPEGGTGCRLMAYLPDRIVVASRRDFAVVR